MKTPLQKAFRDYVANRYYVAQLIALSIMIVGITTIDEFYEPIGAVLLFSITGLVILIPFVYVFIWANQYKKGTRK